jgi:hypothetical protein
VDLYTSQPQHALMAEHWKEQYEQLKAQCQQAQKQEPVACVGPWHDGKLTLIPRYSHQTFERDQPLYTSPPQRTAAVGEDIRKPLTEKEIRTQFCGEKSAYWEFHNGVRYAEAAHGITGEKE